ncbi:sugar transferase [Modestobacter sp. Leaf380]|uniref:sugar transferase n=1 Tax=Modestobacter sp. Leaf380 TaxID=1736356 RepID=UPI0006FE0A62|nr:sugar transferase [Modestobacter sp. Leaf380]KQS68798.1 UDP-phosphate galactose phosphotransferase [Modestobacter sp. Leaf380]
MAGQQLWTAATRTPRTVRRRQRVVPARLRGDGTEARRAWRAGYVRLLVVTDLLAGVLAAGAGYLVRFSPATPVELDHARASIVAAVVLPVVWSLTMLFARAYEERFLWVGAEEFHRVASAAVVLVAVVGTLSWALRLEVARGFVVIALPLATVLTLAARWALRHRLRRRRRRGLHQQTALLVGHRSGVADLRQRFDDQPGLGYRVVGCCLPDGPRDPVPETHVFDGLPVLGPLDAVAEVVQRFSIDTVAILPCPELDGAALRRLGWDLESTDAELLLAPAVTEIAGPRVRIRPTAGLPLLHMERPEFRGVRRLAKDASDRVAAAVLLLVLAPLLVGLAIGVAVTSRGPVFFRHERVGRGGQPFHVLKFRTMVPGADRLQESMLTTSDGNDVQFKMHTDPRVTPIGRVLRRWSLDELPQLINVLGGSMSLVGPRPHVLREVEQYGDDMRRRLLVKPGITGLWQVSGRSDLSWDESVSLDVRYVENWSLAVDALIVLRTVRAVVLGSGAY